MSRFDMELSGQLGQFWKQDALKRIKEAEEDIETGRMILTDVVATWQSNSRCIMDDMAEVVEHSKYADKFGREATRIERDIQNAEFLAEYREQMKDYKPSQEEMAEMRAAFGAGTTVVDVFTGREVLV